MAFFLIVYSPVKQDGSVFEEAGSSHRSSGPGGRRSLGITPRYGLMVLRVYTSL